MLRRSSDFIVLRETLLRRWPGYIFPPIPESLTVGVTEEQIKRNKMKFLNNFLRRISQNKFIYYGE